MFSFNDYATVKTFDDSVDGAAFLGGSRRVDLAIREAVRLVHQGRTDASKIVILLTAGRQGKI